MNKTQRIETLTRLLNEIDAKLEQTQLTANNYSDEDDPLEVESAVRLAHQEAAEYIRERIKQVDYQLNGDPHETKEK